MLTNLRESIKNSKVIKFVLLIFICAPFAFFGINSYFGGGGSSYAVKVNGTEVPVSVYDREYNAQRNRLRQAFGGTIPAGFASEDLLRQQALESVITGQVLSEVVAEQNILVSDTTLAKAITSTEAFQADGRFDQERYEMQLRSSGFTVESFESQFRHDVALQDFRSGIIDSGFVLESEQKTADKLASQIRNAVVINYKLQPVLEQTNIDEADIATFFEENADNYQHPERVKIEYIELDTEALKSTIEVDEAEVQAYFEGNSDNYRVPEERSASHILITVEEGASDADKEAALEKIQQARARIEAGEDFSAVAKEESDDPGSALAGGSLGFFGRGAMVPEFEEVAFSLEEGVVSEPVLSSFGYHIIRVDEIREEHGKEFDAVRDEVTDLLKQQKANEIFYDKSELLANESYENPDSLIPASEAGGFTIEESDWIDRLSREGIAASPAVINAALTPDVLNEGNNSEVLELGDNHVVVLRVKEHEGVRPKTLDEVRDEIAGQLKAERASEILQQKTADSLERLKSGDTVEAVVEEFGGELTAEADYTRNTEDLEGAQVSALFSMAKPADGDKQYTSVSLPGGDQSMLILNAVTENESEESGVVAESSLLNGAQTGSAEYSALLRELRSKALVEINQQILQPQGTQ